MDSNKYSPSASHWSIHIFCYQVRGGTWPPGCRGTPTSRCAGVSSMGFFVPTPWSGPVSGLASLPRTNPDTICPLEVAVRRLAPRYSSVSSGVMSSSSASACHLRRCQPSLCSKRWSPDHVVPDVPISFQQFNLSNNFVVVIPR
jgi:hypothetical protein